MLTQPIKTERLIIRRFELDDWQAVFTFASNPNVMHFMGEGVLATETQCQQFVEKNSSDEAEAFAVLLKNEDKVIGYMVYHLWFGPRTYELGWVFHPAHQGKGYATEAAQVLLKHSFEMLQRPSRHRHLPTRKPGFVSSDGENWDAARRAFPEMYSA